MTIRACLVALLALPLLFLPTAAKADSLIGSTVSATASSPYAPPTQTPSSAVIGNGVEFSGILNFSPNYGFTQDFSSNGLVISFTGPANTTTFGDNAFTFTYTDPLFFQAFALTSYTCPSCYFSTSQITGNTFAGHTETLQFYAVSSGAIYTFSTAAATPEPSSLVLLGTGVLGVLATARRRFV